MNKVFSIAVVLVALCCGLSPADPADTGNAIMDIYRVEDSLIVEHWDAYISVPPRDEWLNDNGML